MLNSYEKFNVGLLKIYERNGFAPPGNFPQTALRKLRPRDLIGLSSKDLALMRNEIFARHGKVFKKPTYKNYFQGQDWYKKTPKRANFGFMDLSEVEARNVCIILAAEREKAVDKSSFDDDIFHRQ